jgi:para-aminobenzoate synthetase / 4-amino-4-deoxychorismate lyase
VVLVREGTAMLPPLDGRLLPGTGRRAVLDALDDAALSVCIRPFGTGEIGCADGMFLVNAVRGVRWVRTVEGPGVAVRFAAPDPLTRRVAALLAG